MAVNDGVQYPRDGGGGNGGGDPAISRVNFMLPEYYEGLDQDGSFRIPEGKEVRFYTLSQPDISKAFSPIITSRGKPAATRLSAYYRSLLKTKPVTSTQ